MACTVKGGDNLCRRRVFQVPLSGLERRGGVVTCWASCAVQHQEEYPSRNLQRAVKLFHCNEPSTFLDYSSVRSKSWWLLRCACHHLHLETPQETFLKSKAEQSPAGPGAKSSALQGGRLLGTSRQSWGSVLTAQEGLSWVFWKPGPCLLQRDTAWIKSGWGAAWSVVRGRCLRVLY